MRTRLERRKLSYTKLKKKERYLKVYGERQGTLYIHQREKIHKSLGYMNKGPVSHFVQVGYLKNKTRKRNRYGKVEDWSPRDIRSIDRYKEFLNDM